MLRSMCAAPRCSRRQLVAGIAASAALGAWPGGTRAAAAAPGGTPWGTPWGMPWVLADEGRLLQQLHPDTLQVLHTQALQPRWLALLLPGPQALGRRADGALQRLGGAATPPPAPMAVACSADGRWLCAVEGDTLQLRDAALAPLRRWPLPAAVAWLSDLPLRQAFVLAFADRAELWQLSYDERAEDFYDGLVHDFRFGEGVPTRAFHNVRRMALPEPLLHASAEATQSELAGQGWVFNLDARKRVRAQPLLQPPAPGCGAPLGLLGQPLLAMPVRGQARLDLFSTVDWERAASVALPQPVDAVLAQPGAARLAAWALGGPLLLVDPARGQAQAVAGLGPLRAPPRWRSDGAAVWVPTEDALCTVDPATAQISQRQPLPGLLALA